MAHGHMRWEARRRLASGLAGQSVYSVEKTGSVSDTVIGKGKNRGERANNEERVAGRDWSNNDNVRVMGPEFGYGEGECIEEGNTKEESKVVLEMIIQLNENRR